MSWGANSGNDLSTLKIKRARFHQSGTLEKQGFSPIDKPLLHASYKAAFLCAKKKQATHSSRRISETFRNGNGKSLLGVEAEKF